MVSAAALAEGKAANEIWSEKKPALSPSTIMDCLLLVKSSELPCKPWVPYYFHLASCLSGSFLKRSLTPNGGSYGCFSWSSGMYAHNHIILIGSVEPGRLPPCALEVHVLLADLEHELPPGPPLQASKTPTASQNLIEPSQLYKSVRLKRQPSLSTENTPPYTLILWVLPERSLLSPVPPFFSRPSLLLHLDSLMVPRRFAGSILEGG